ncbi:MAG: flagellar hook-associated protein FlgL [Pseudomonadota bacterium]
MRIATSQFYRQAMTAMQQQSAKVQQTQLQLTSGLKILRPSDDPSGSVKVLNLNANMGEIDQYGRNLSAAKADLSMQEDVLQSINDSLQRIRELTVQANNPTNHDSARLSIAKEIDQRMHEIVSLANSRDVNGEYMFSGTQTTTTPFVQSGDDFIYQGDQSIRKLQIGEGQNITVRDTGDNIFMKIPNGDGRVQVEPGANNTGSVLIGQYSASNAFVRDDYSVEFSLQGPDQKMFYTIRDSATPANTVASAEYIDGNTISFTGVNIALTGVPKPGDTLEITPAENTNVFDLVGSISAALKIPAADSAATAKIQNAMGRGLANIDQALQTVNNQRATLGARLNTIDATEDVNLDFKLQLENVLSDTQDLDYAEAISRFNQQLTSLQAAQQAFVKTTELSLFRFL